MSIPAQAVVAALEACKATRTQEAIEVHTIRNTLVFLLPATLETYREKVAEWLHCLPPSFQEEGDWFSNACYDRNGDQWGDHIHMEALFTLATGLRLVENVAWFGGMNTIYRVK
jgi:hypothetical protein